MAAGICAWSRDHSVSRGNGVVWVEVTILVVNILTFFTRKTPVASGAIAHILFLKVRRIRC